jgi:membrane fusion protein, macrolide-specific efflux system
MNVTTRNTLPWTALLLAITVVVTCSGCNFLPSEEEILAPPLIKPAKIVYKTQAATRGDLVLKLDMSGDFQPELQQSLSFKSQDGRLKTLHVQLGQSVKAGDPIAELDSGDLESSIRIQELEVRKVALTLSQLKVSGADKYSIERTDLELQQQRIMLDNLKRRMSATRIIAPFDGVITYLTSVPLEGYVGAYEMVARIADDRKLVLITTANQANELPIGAQVSVEIKKTTYQGVVVANPSSLYDAPDERLHKAAIIRLNDGIPEAVTAGSSARILYIQDQRDNVVLLPRSEINLMSGRKFVNVLEDGVRVEKDVEVGLQTDTEAEIISGIEEGDLVIIG